MIGRRAAAVLFAGILLLAVTGSTSAFSAVTADRSVTVGVVDDTAAFLAIERSTTSDTNGTTLSVTVVNQFPHGVELSNVTVSHGDRKRPLANDTTVLFVGDTATATFENASCNGTITVHAKGESVSIDLERPVECT
jgi:hypothetical protein